jgi:uncharacterized protein YndB with AHSA1/START domain
MTTEVPFGTFVDKHTLRFDIVYPHPAKRVWAAITEPDQVARWFLPLELEARVGGRFVMPRDDGRPPRGTGTVAAFEDGRLLELQFEEGETHFGQGCVVRFELADRADGCLVSFIHRLSADVTYPQRPSAQPGGPGTFPPGTAAGWHGFADGLGRLLHGRPGALYDESDDALMADRTKAYAERIR